MRDGVLAGYPVRNVKVSVYDGKEHPVDSKEIAFQTAGREGLKKAMLNAGPVMLVEPGHFMYAGLTKEKIDRIIDEHIIGGNVVSEYLIHDELWDDAISPSAMMAQMGR